MECPGTHSMFPFAVVLPAACDVAALPSVPSLAEDCYITSAVPHEGAGTVSPTATVLEDDVDFSSNAKSDVLEKYSRFYDKKEFSLWCNSPHLNYTDSFRDLLYQINPYHIICVHKRMFDLCATNKLRVVDMEGIDDNDRPAITTEAQTLTAGCLLNGHMSEPTRPRQSQPQHVDTSNSCIYSSGSIIYKEKTRPNSSKEFRGWDICERPHSASCTGYHKSTIEETRESGRKQPANCRTMSPRGFNTPRDIRHINNHSGSQCHYATGSSRKVSRERGEYIGSCSSSSASSVNTGCSKVGKKFKHFRRDSSYMEQYREEYTYRKLIDSRPISLEAFLCPCGMCPESLTSTGCIPCCYPNQSQRVQIINITSREACENSNMGTQRRSQHQPVIKKRAARHPTVKPLNKHKLQSDGMATVKMDERSSENFMWAKEGVLKMEFFPSSLTVNNYNPMKANSAPPLTLSGSPTSGVIVSRSRPSIPSNSRGVACPASFSTSPIPQYNKGVQITRHM